MATPGLSERRGSRGIRFCFGCNNMLSSEQTTSSSRTSAPPEVRLDAGHRGRRGEQRRRRRHLSRQQGDGSGGPSSCVSGSRLFYLQGLIIWILLAVPGNLITLVLWSRTGQHVQVDQEAGQVGLAINATVEETSQHKVVKASNESLMGLLCLRVTFPLHLLQRCREACMHKGDNEGDLTLPDICIEALNDTHIDDNMEFTTTHRTTQKSIALSEDSLPCYELRAEYSGLVTSFRFWTEGVLLFGLGMLGLVGNLMTMLVLSRVKRNRNFNNLLVALSVCDFLLILDLMLEMSVFTEFMDEEPEWYKLAYPLLMHPLRGFIQTSTIYMVVAVSAERYKAVCQPLARRQSYYKYIMVAVATSISLELPRFLEFRRAANGSDFVTSDLMEDPDYIQMNSYWNELFATGALPLFALVYMNTHIYLKIRASSAFAARTHVPGRFSNTKGNVNSVNSTRNTRIVLKDLGPAASASAAAAAMPSPPVMVSETSSASRTPIATQETSFSFASNQLRVHQRTRGPPRLTPPPPRRQLSHSVSIVSDDAVGVSQTSSRCATPATPLRLTHCRRQLTVKSTGSSVSSRGVRRRMEKSTIILVAIVIIFVFCHTYRLLLRIYEMANPGNNTFEHYQHCIEQERYHIPVVFYLLINFHHLFLLLNSSVNFIIYCCVGKDFRTDLSNVVARACRCPNADNKPNAAAATGPAPVAVAAAAV